MTIGTSSVYTTGNFDGMALVIDSYGGKVRSSSMKEREDVLTSSGWRYSRIHE